MGETETQTITAAGDLDWFKVTLSAGMNYSFTVNSSGGPGIGLPGPDIYLYDGLGNVIDWSTQYSATTGTVNFQALTAGSYFVGIGDYSGNQTGQFAVSWVASDTIRANASTDRVLTANATTTSRIDANGDADWFKASMTAGLSYGFEVKGNGLDGLAAGDIQLRDNLGNILDTSTSYSVSVNELDHNATRTGLYYISVFDGGGATGNYALRWIASDTIQNNVSTGISVARGASVTSRIDVEGDSDWFKVTMVAGQSYGYEVKATTTGFLPDGDLRLYDSLGNLVDTQISYSTSTNTLAFTAVQSGTYFIAVNDDGGDIGNYTLRNVGFDTLLANTATTAKIADGTMVSGLIDTREDSDWHRIEAQQGVTYSFTLSGDGSAAELDYVQLVLRDGSGDVIQSFSGTSTTITYTATTSGPLFLDAQGYYDDGVGKYRLSVVSTDPTLVGSGAADRLRGGATNTAITLYGGNDWADGGLGNDRLLAGLGNDTLLGGAGDDRLLGDAGTDNLSGGSGKDWLEGGAGNDVLRGGVDADVFAFRKNMGVDHILDYQDGLDKIRITGGPSTMGGLSMAQVADDVRITFGGTTIWVDSTTKAELTKADFLFA